MKRFFMFFYVALIITFCTTNVQATPLAITPQAEVQLILSEYDVSKESKNIVGGVEFKLKPGWKIYWRTPGDVGFPPKVSRSGSDNIQEVDWQWPVPERHVEVITESYSAESYVYQGRVVFPIYITPMDANASVSANFTIEYAICKDICIPNTVTLRDTINPGALHQDSRATIQEFQRFVPVREASQTVLQEAYYSSNKTFTVVLKDSSGFSQDVDLFVEGGENIAFTKPDIIRDGDQITFISPVVFLTDDRSFKGITLTLKNGMSIQEFKKGSIEKKEVIRSASSEQQLGWIILLALIGGLILNVMPCVLPVLSIKILGVIQQGGSHVSQVRLSFIAAASGIIVSFIALSVVILLLQSAEKSVGWGFHFQEPAFIIFLIILLTLFAANLWGWFTISLPSWLTTTSGSPKRETIGSHFASGVLATLLATPCTAPFVGTAVGFALTQGGYSVIIIFAAMGVGMAMPYLALVIFPGWSHHLPKPGIWMVYVKYVLGVFLLATALWLLWVLSNQLGHMAAWVLLAIMLIKLMKLRFFWHRPTFIKWGVAILVVMAFMLPLNVFNRSPERHLLESSLWQPFDEQGIATYVSEGKTVFVDVTADWCLTCKVNKWTTLRRESVMKLLSQSDIVAMQADWTNKNQDIARYLKKHERSGIPFNVVYGPRDTEGKVLPELLSPTLIKEALEAVR